MDQTKKHKLYEITQLLKSPMYYCYLLGLVLVFLLTVLPMLLDIKNFPDMAGGGSFSGSIGCFFSSKMGEFLVFFPAFVVTTAVLRDIRDKKLYGTLARKGLTPYEAVSLRVKTQVLMMLLPVLLLAGLTMTLLPKGTNWRFVILGIALFWLVPTIFAVTSLSTLMTELTGTCYAGIITQAAVWILTVGSTAKIGDYNSCLAIRHNTFGEFGIIKQKIVALTINRVVVILLSILFMMFAAWARKRRQEKGAGDVSL